MWMSYVASYHAISTNKQTNKLCCCSSSSSSYWGGHINQNNAFLTNFTMLSADCTIASITLAINCPAPYQK
jgi:hypothetical protein